MRLKTGKVIFLLGFWTFFLLLLKESFPKAAYAGSCLASPVCAQLIGAGARSAVAAPTSAGSAATISVTTATGATTTTKVAAGVAVVGDVRIAGIAAYYVWDQFQNERAQDKARGKYCAANQKDLVCAPPFTGGQCQGMRYVIHVEYSYNHYQGTSAPRVGWNDFFGPIEGIVDNSSTGSATVNLYLRGRNHENNIYERFLIYTSKNSLNYAKIVSLQPLYPNQTDNCGNPPPLGWKDWPQAKRDAAVALLSKSDWLDLVGSMPDAGLLGPGDKINASGGIIFPGLDKDDPKTPPDESQPQKTPGPYTSPKDTRTAQWPSYLNIPGLNNREKFRLKERVDKGKLTQEDVRRIRPRPIPDDPNKRRCLEIPLVGHLGDSPQYPYHGQYATEVTGSPNDLFVMAPDGTPYGYYDGEVNKYGNTYLLEDEGAVAELKTQHEWLIKVARNEPLTTQQRRNWIDMQEQLRFQAWTARVCKLQYFIAFDMSNVAKVAGPMLVDLLKGEYPLIRVHFMPSDRPGSASLLRDSIAKSIIAELTSPHTTSSIAQQSFNKLTPDGEQRDLGGSNNGEPNNKHSKLTIPQQQTRTRLARSTALVLSR